MRERYIFILEINNLISKYNKMSATKKKKKTKTKSAVNTYFDKVFVINLFDNEKRWKTMDKSMKRRNIKADRFIAIDGRCKNQGLAACKQKLKSLELTHNVTIKIPKGYSHQEIIPASSLTIGTIVLMRAMVKNKWKRMLIFEDDVDFGRNFEKKFREGIKGLGKKPWDMLYLGCGSLCGHKDVSNAKSKNTPYLSTMAQVLGNDNLWVKYKNDLRNTCEEDSCSSVTGSISNAESPGGTWCYGVSLKGAKKILKLIGDAGQHIDQIYKTECEEGNLKCLAFDPPIVWHQEGYFRTNTDIPWKD